MLSCNELIKLESNISDKTESDIQDNARLNIIDQLSAQGFYTEAEDIFFKLNSSESEWLARDIIEKNRKLGIRKSDEYIKINNNIPSYDDKIIIKENYEDICKYLETKKNSLTYGIITHITNRIGKLPEASEKRNLLWRLDRYIKTYEINLKKEMMYYKQQEANRLRTLEKAREKQLKWKLEMSAVLATMTKKEKNLYLSSDLPLKWVTKLNKKKFKSLKKINPHLHKRALKKDL